MRNLASLALVAFFTSLAACGGAAPLPEPAEPLALPRPIQPAQPDARDEGAERAAQLDALTEAEAKKGECSPEHEEALERLVAELEAGLKAKEGDDGAPLGLQIVGKRVLALGPDARAIEMSVSGRGTEVHVLAYAVRDVSIDVLQGTAAATTLRSPYQRAPTAAPLAIELPNVGRVTELLSDSRQVQIKPGQPLQVRLTGQGCAALVSALRP
jgi:hypothetical protein